MDSLPCNRRLNRGEFGFETHTNKGSPSGSLASGKFPELPVLICTIPDASDAYLRFHDLSRDFHFK
jgi:hypothetical protein